MATRSSVLAWRIPGTGEPCGLLFMGLVEQSWTQLKRLSSSSNNRLNPNYLLFCSLQRLAQLVLLPPISQDILFIFVSLCKQYLVYIIHSFIPRIFIEHL